MYPSLRAGDVVIVAPLDGAPIRLGEIVLFRDVAGSPVLHRVLRRTRCNRETYQTRGDAVLRLDEAIGAERILGRVRRIEGGEGREVWDAEHPLYRIAARLRALVLLAQSAVYYKLSSATAKGPHSRLASARGERGPEKVDANAPEIHHPSRD